MFSRFHEHQLGKHRSNSSSSHLAGKMAIHLGKGPFRPKFAPSPSLASNSTFFGFNRISVVWPRATLYFPPSQTTSGPIFSRIYPPPPSVTRDVIYERAQGKGGIGSGRVFGTISYEEHSTLLLNEPSDSLFEAVSGGSGVSLGCIQCLLL